jgi:hypothetical protein
VGNCCATGDDVLSVPRLGVSSTAFDAAAVIGADKLRGIALKKSAVGVGGGDRRHDPGEAW